MLSLYSLYHPLLYLFIVSGIVVIVIARHVCCFCPADSQSMPFELVSLYLQLSLKMFRTGLCCLQHTSTIVLSATYLYIGEVFMRSFINIIQFLGPDAVPWRTPRCGLQRMIQYCLLLLAVGCGLRVKYF